MGSLTHLIIRNLADKIETFTVVSLFRPISGEATVPVGVCSFGRVWRDREENIRKRCVDIQWG